MKVIAPVPNSPPRAVGQPKMPSAVDLSKFDNSWYRPGGKVRLLLWYFCNEILLKSCVPYPSSFKGALLRLFGTRVGRGVVIKPNVNVKYPWLLEIGDCVWLGEGAWIDNLTHVKIGNNVCISQGAYVLTGNHDYKRPAFDLILKPVVIEDGVWVGARAVICPGVTLGTHSVVTVGAVMTKNAEAFTIYSGNPATPARRRMMVEAGQVTVS
jgi:putative colanic acid biosynthesis acetyltransferase WcaF